MVLGHVETCRVPIRQTAQRLACGLDGHQHPLHVGVVDDRRGLASGRSGSASLTPILGVLKRLLISTIAQRQTLQTHRKAGLVHHGEHVLHAPVLFADEIAGGTTVVAERQHACGTGVNAQFVFHRHAGDVVLASECPVVVHQILRHDETRDAFGSRRRVRGAGQNQMNDVVGHVVFAERDVDLRARDAVRTVGVLDRLGANRSDITSGVGLGEVHGARPLARDHLGQVGHLL